LDLPYFAMSPLRLGVILYDWSARSMVVYASCRDASSAFSFAGQLLNHLTFPLLDELDGGG
jgi:hypothetical protein